MRQSFLPLITGDAIVVIGSANSSNTVALEKLARDSGCGRVFRVNGADELPDDLRGVVGVTAGASAPEELVDDVIAAVRRFTAGAAQSDDITAMVVRFRGQAQ